jgi:uncharacterized protein (DUF2062 family)
MISRLRQAYEVLFHVGDTPHRTALAFGIGLWIAFSPLLGLHTVMALGIAFAFRLSRGAMLLGAYINNPWTIAPLYIAGTTLGCFLLEVPPEGLVDIDWDQHGLGFYRSLVAHLRPFLWPYVIGNTVLGVVAGVVGYVVLRSVLERRRAQAAGITGGLAS